VITKFSKSIIITDFYVNFILALIYCL